jgi:hypothetical protein
MNYGFRDPISLHADHLCETTHVVVETPLGVPLGLGSKTTLGVVDTPGGVHLGTALLVLARVILTSGLTRAHCIPRPKIFLGQKMNYLELERREASWNSHRLLNCTHPLPSFFASFAWRTCVANGARVRCYLAIELRDLVWKSKKNQSIIARS